MMVLYLVQVNMIFVTFFHVTKRTVSDLDISIEIYSASVSFFSKFKN